MASTHLIFTSTFVALKLPEMQERCQRMRCREAPSKNEFFSEH
jgi:hypothetical protein